MNENATQTPRMMGSADVAGSASELNNLRRRVQMQRRELRRLNKEVSGPRAAFWRGFQRGLEADKVTALRGRMNAVFGHVAVWEAENGKPHPSRNQQNDQAQPTLTTTSTPE